MLPEECTIEFLREQVAMEYYSQHYFKSREQNDFLYRVVNYRNRENFTVIPVFLEKGEMKEWSGHRQNMPISYIEKVYTKEQAKIFLFNVKEKR